MSNVDETLDDIAAQFDRHGNVGTRNKRGSKQTGKPMFPLSKLARALAAGKRPSKNRPYLSKGT